MPRLVDTGRMPFTEPRELLRTGTLDPRTVALIWLLLDGGVPLVVAGSAATTERLGLASALLSLDPGRRWVVLDSDEEAVTADRLTALLRGGSGVGITLAADDLEGVLDRFVAGGLPEDAVRRLGVVIIAAEVGPGLRCTVVHYLRPTERDAQGHLQRRPPAVLAAWDEHADSYEDYAWGITPELADRAAIGAADDYAARVASYLAAEPPRVPAPKHDAAKPSPFSAGLTDPDPQPHEH
jgi:hypothetical protein